MEVQSLLQQMYQVMDTMAIWYDFFLIFQIFNQ